MAASPPKAKRVKYSSVGGAAKYGTKYKQQWEEETRMFHAVRSASAAFFVGCAAKMLAATIKGRQMWGGMRGVQNIRPKSGAVLVAVDYKTWGLCLLEHLSTPMQVY